MLVFDRPVYGNSGFIGREQLMRSVFRGLQQGRDFAIVGGPRTGRTSVLAQLLTLTHQQWVREPRATKVVPVTLDLESVNQSGAEFVPKALWEQVVAATSDPKIHGQGGALPKFRELKFLRGVDPWQLVRDALAEAWRAHAGTMAWCQYVLFIDNADWLFTHRLDAAAEPLAAFLAAEDPGAPLAYVISGARLVREDLRETSSLFRGARMLGLGVLRESEARSLGKTQLPHLDTATLDEAMRLTGRHPYMLQRVFAELELHGDAGIEGVGARLAPELEPLYARLWGELDMNRGVTYRGAYAAPEHALMQLLIDYQVPVPLGTAERELGIKPLKEFAELLEYLGVAEQHLRGNTILFSAPNALWNDWYVRRVAR